MTTRLKGSRCLSRFDEHKKGTKEASPGGTTSINVTTSFGMREILKT